MRKLLATALIATLLACSSRSPAPIYDRSASPYRRGPGPEAPVKRPAYHVVHKGDTLYAIAWRYGLDHKVLARWNGISPPYTIFPNERLRLSEPDVEPRSRRTAEVETQALPVRTEQTMEPAGSPAGSGTAANRSTASAAIPEPKPQRAPEGDRPRIIRWQWPADGKVLNSFEPGNSRRNGIDIAGEAGAEVRAAAAGEVVYSGSGLVGYGELIIIKHNQRYLSAYGHNRTRLVHEGDQVRAGDKIAELGRSGTSEPKLHFEIRDNGQPVDPQTHLPRR